MTASNSLTPDVLDKIYEKGAAHAPAIMRPDGGTEVLVPEGYRPHTIPALEPKLPRIRQKVTFYDLESFTSYVNAFKSGASRIFAVPGHLAQGGGASVKVILDYHKAADANATGDGAAGGADYGAHVVHYVPKYSDPWTTWTQAKPMLQADFAEFIEENREDVRRPEAAVLLDIITKFKVSKKVDYDSVVHQPNGDILIGWSERTEIEGSKTGVSVPTELLLGIPVFFKGPAYQVRCFMRYKLNNGKVTFTIKPDRPEYIEQDAFDEITAKVGEATGIVPLLGVPA